MPILQPIKPQYCELIATGKKTIEVRKSRPKIKTPFKVYIYCTKNGFYGLQSKSNPALKKNASGKVIGEYVCNRIDEYPYIDVYEAGEGLYPILTSTGAKTGLDYSDIKQYGNGKPLYLWYITDLKIYDKPKELSEFGKECNLDCPSVRCPYWKYQRVNADEWDYDCSCNNIRPLTRPPQSWCYCMEVT